MNRQRSGTVMFSQMSMGKESNSDALEDYSESNDKLLQEDSTLTSIVHLKTSKLFTSGLVFFVGKEWHVPDEDFMFVVRSYWEAFMTRSYCFIIAHGFLVWYRGKINDIIYPEVPDYSQISIDMYYDEKNGQTVLSASWKNNKIKTPLYIFHRALPFRVTPENRMSLVDKVKPLLRMLYQLTEARLVASYMNANPPMVIQRTKQQDPTQKGVSSSLAVQDPVIEYEDRVMADNGIDEAYVEKMHLAASHPAYQTYVGKEEYGQTGPKQFWERAEMLMQRRPESRFLFIPGGLQYANSTPGHVDPDYLRVRSGIVAEIYQAFGIPPSMMPSDTARVNATVEMHNTTFINTMQMWWRIYSLLMTDVFRIIYGDGDVMSMTMDNDNKPPKSGEDSVVKDMDSDGKLFSGRKVDDDPSKGKKTEKKSVTVYLRSQFISSPEQIEKLYSQKVISFSTFQRLRTDSIGIPDLIVDPSLKEPLELLAQEEILLSGGGMGSTLKPQSLSGFSTDATKRPTKKPKTSE